MNMRMMLYLAVGGMLLGGCGHNVGWVIRPIPVEEPLRETVIAADPGLFVTDKILVLDIDGLLLNQRRKGALSLSMGENPVSLLIEKLDKAEGDSSVKAVVVRINSPGGGVTASDVMYNRLRQFRECRKVPVIAVIEDVGASGGYYIACAADTILAHPTSVTGSIGAVMQTVSLAGTMKLLRIDAKAVTSGSRKDMVSPFKPLDPEELAILQKMVDEFHQRFLRVVEQGRRDLDAKKIEGFSDGRVFTGSQAKANGLVDELGYVSDAIALAKRRCKSRKVKVVMYHRPLGRRVNAYSTAPPAPANPQVNLVNISAGDLLLAAQPQFLYLWTGHTHR